MTGLVATVPLKESTKTCKQSGKPPFASIVKSINQLQQHMLGNLTNLNVVTNITGNISSTFDTFNKLEEQNRFIHERLTLQEPQRNENGVQKWKSLLVMVTQT